MRVINMALEHGENSGQESSPMNNEEMQPGIAMETASPHDQLDKKRVCTLLLKEHTDTVPSEDKTHRMTKINIFSLSHCDQWPE